jgi:hypothetical protein
MERYLEISESFLGSSGWIGDTLFHKLTFMIYYSKQKFNKTVATVSDSIHAATTFDYFLHLWLLRELCTALPTYSGE